MSENKKVVSIVEMRKKEIAADAVMDRVIAAIAEATQGMRDGTDTPEVAAAKLTALRAQFHAEAQAAKKRGG